MLISDFKQVCHFWTRDWGQRAVEGGGSGSELRKWELNLHRINTEALAGAQPQGLMPSSLVGPSWSNRDLLWLWDCPKGMVFLDSSLPLHLCKAMLEPQRPLAASQTGMAEILEQEGRTELVLGS